MTQLVEDITIKITLNHCEGGSTVMLGPNDLRQEAAEYIENALHEFIYLRGKQTVLKTPGIHIEIEATGLYEAPEVGGSDN
jgi:hypothetical protein